jgi:hypothetical protein
MKNYLHSLSNFRVCFFIVTLCLDLFRNLHDENSAKTEVTQAIGKYNNRVIWKLFINLHEGLSSKICLEIFTLDKEH